MDKDVLICAMVMAALIIMTGCGSHEAVFRGKEYPPTEKVETVFMKSQIPAPCRVFAHLFATMPAGYRGSDFAAAVAEEARVRGADMMLVGQSRQCTTGNSLAFDYYGPDREYRVRDWPGWTYGFDDWARQGDWTGIGYNEWGNPDIYFDYPIVMQIVLLRCQQDELHESTGR